MNLVWPIDDILVKEFEAEFPERKDKLTNGDFINYYFSRILLHRLMPFYDIVVGYANEGFYPLMCRKPYFCYEHGTIRDIPYVNDTQGRICSLT
jgi:hypothetical protein